MTGEEPAHRQRIRIGLTGLGFVFLLVLIGAAITRWGAEPDPDKEAKAANAALAPPNDPLAEIGAAPGDSSAANAAAESSKKKKPPSEQ